VVDGGDDVTGERGLPGPIPRAGRQDTVSLLSRGIAGRAECRSDDGRKQRHNQTLQP
jgi:hypothetical protein